ncbi:MAG: hypothetical protein AAFR61_15555, partial [Bacteroidota bacterium]
KALFTGLRLVRVGMLRGCSNIPFRPAAPSKGAWRDQLSKTGPRESPFQGAAAGASGDVARLQ